MENLEVTFGRHTLLPFRQLQYNHRPVSIGNKALQILSTLAAAKGQIVTKFELMNIVWSGLIVDENSLHVHVAALRRALGDDAGLLITVRGLGYRLDSRFVEHSSYADLQSYRSIAVLAFINMTGNPAMDYLGEGISEELINSLSRTTGLKVSSRTSSFAFQHRNVDAREICEKLGVNALVEGSVRIAGGRARVTAQLIDGDNGTHVWSQNFDHEFADLFDLQGDITEEIMRSLSRFLFSSRE
ncbi:MAG: winged helix-turn-helix domain-containing protein [Sphingorhabdus sp.]